MDHNEHTKKNDSEPPKVRSRKYANILSSDDAVVDEMRSSFVREIAVTSPEVLEKLRDSVWPEYIKAYNAAMQNGAYKSSDVVRFGWPQSLQIAVLAWAKDVRLLHDGKPPDWVLAQVEVTLWLWTQHPERFSKHLCWGFVGGYSADRKRRSQSPFLIELPQFTWHWVQGFEDKRSAKQRIMKTVGEIVDRRLREMEQTLGNLPRLQNKRRPEHFTWTVLHQVRGVQVQELATSYGVSCATVKNEVMALKARLGIGLPKGRRPLK
jgi:hypothetical protein